MLNYALTEDDYKEIKKIKEEFERIISICEKKIKGFKSIERVKTKKGEDFKILSKNFNNCHKGKNVCGYNCLFFPDFIDIRVYDWTKPDDVEKEIQKEIEYLEKLMSNTQKKLDLVEEYYTKYKRVIKAFYQKIKDIDNELEEKYPGGYLDVIFKRKLGTVYSI